MGYYEGNLEMGNSGFGGGWEGLIGLALVASLFGGGWGGFGGYGNRGAAGSEVLGYELGKVATQADIASGFNNSAVLSSLNDLKLGQSTNYAGIQQTLCQGFNGINTAILTTANAIDRSIADCCCQTSRMMERNTCDIIQAGNANTQRIIDYLNNEKMSSLQAENSLLKGQLSQNAQTSAIVNALAPKQPIPAYTVANPYCCNTGCTTIQ